MSVLVLIIPCYNTCQYPAYNHVIANMSTAVGAVSMYLQKSKMASPNILYSEAKRRIKLYSDVFLLVAIICC